MGGMLSAFYASLCCSRREATAFMPLLQELSSPYAQYYAVSRYNTMDDVYVGIAHTSEDQLVQATKVVLFIAAEITGYPPPPVLNLEPDGTQRCLEMSIECVGISIVVSFYNKVADDWIKNGRSVQVTLPSASSKASGATQQSRVRGTVGRMLERGIKQEEMARAIKELRFEVHLSGYRVLTIPSI